MPHPFWIASSRPQHCYNYTTLHTCILLLPLCACSSLSKRLDELLKEMRAKDMKEEPAGILPLGDPGDTRSDDHDVDGDHDNDGDGLHGDNKDVAGNQDDEHYGLINAHV